MKNIFILSFVLLSISAYSQDTTKLIPTETQMLVNVSVTNFQNIPRPYEIIIFESVKEKKLYSGKTNAKGKYSLLLPKGDTYLIKYKEFTDSTEYSEFEIPNKPGKYTSELKIQIEPPKTYTLENVFFDTGLSTLKTTSYKSLNDLVEVMKLKPSLIIEIGGHTDNTGSTEINLKLSQDRADAVRNYLIKKGISSSRITAVGYGDSLPVADNLTEEGKAKNRRTEVKIIKE
ncbi:MAG TPA: OmpA family protein [Bacteroidales bacterium]|nr:OmpA family protein [Bacteroidales bacterium]HPS45743.1 OmpA family protein [Bacteroidales bacterium]HQH19576.1 OmpA family protein [Bacteroidales bacterium]HQI45415.1 OmpA family protein [Bacteroidales bacterium]